MRVRLTQYWKIELDVPNTWQSYTRPDDPAGMDIDGVMFPPGFLRAIAMEGCGTGMGKVIAYDNNSWYFVDGDKYPHGIDAMDGALVPFKSIAVDPREFVMGDTYHICELVGKTMPDGSIHNGMVKACDVGDMIHADHVDFFVGTKQNWRDISIWLPQFVNIEHIT